MLTKDLLNNLVERLENQDMSSLLAASDLAQANFIECLLKERQVYRVQKLYADGHYSRDEGKDVIASTMDEFRKASEDFVSAKENLRRLIAYIYR